MRSTTTGTSSRALPTTTPSPAPGCRRRGGVLKPDGALWVIGSYHNIFRVGAALQDLDFWMLNDVIWRKANPMPNFRGTRFTNAHETLIWAAREPEEPRHLQLRSDEAGQRRHADAQRLAVPDLHRRRAAQGRRPTTSCIRRRSRKPCSTASSMRRPSRATWCSTRSSAPARPARWRGSSAGTSSASSARTTYVAAALKRIAAVKPLRRRGAARRRCRSAPRPRVPFGSLVEQGADRAGHDSDDDRKRFVGAWCGPTARCASGPHQGSIHRVGALVQGAEACNGWTFWHLEQQGRLDAHRSSSAPSARERAFCLTRTSNASGSYEPPVQKGRRFSFVPVSAARASGPWEEARQRFLAEGVGARPTSRRTKTECRTNRLRSRLRVPGGSG